MDRLHVSDQERHFASPLLYDSRASSGRDRRRRGLPGARSVTAHDSWVFGEWCAGAMRAGSRCSRRWPRCRFNLCSAAAASFYYSLGVIADFGDDAGMMPEIVRNVHGRSPIKIEADDLQLIQGHDIRHIRSELATTTSAGGSRRIRFRSVGDECYF